MTRMTTEEVQRVSLDVLRHIDEFCKAKDITYFLDAGTLIGAMRHGGFIPWDDDADVLMPRQDYDRFIREYTDGDNYRLYDPSKGNSYLPYARLCEMSKTFFGQHLPWTKESPGVGVDVFPLDGAPASKEQYDDVALSIHSVVPVVLVLLGYPVGVWMVRHFLEIPLDRIDSCVIVWRFTCATCFVGMFNVPFQAMYTAKQEIAELTIYSFVTTTLNALFLYYMISNPGFWLVRYAVWMCIVGIVPQLVIAIRAVFKYRECRFVKNCLWNVERYRQLMRFVVAQFWSNFSSVFSTQGQAILVNKYMGASYNASMSLGNSIASQSLTLSSSLDAAFWPAITNKTGEGDIDGVKKLCYMSMRISTLLVLVFAVPLAMEIHEVLRLWLVNPPDFTAEICLIMLARAVFERMTTAYATAIYGYGTGVMRYSWTVGWAGISTVLVSWLLFAMGLKMWSIMGGLIVSKMITVCVRLWMGRFLVGFGFWYWVKHVFSPIVILTTLVMLGAFVVQFTMTTSFVRIVWTTCVCEVILLPCAWLLLFEENEKEFLRQRLAKFLPIISK